MGCERCLQGKTYEKADNTCQEYCKSQDWSAQGICKDTIEPDKACMVGCIISLCQGKDLCVGESLRLRFLSRRKPPALTPPPAVLSSPRTKNALHTTGCDQSKTNCCPDKSFGGLPGCASATNSYGKSKCGGCNPDCNSALKLVTVVAHTQLPLVTHLTPACPHKHTHTHTHTQSIPRAPTATERVGPQQRFPLNHVRALRLLKT